MEVLFAIVGIILGGLLIYFILRPKLNTVQQLDKQTEEKNKEIQLLYEKLLDDQNLLLKDIQELSIEKTILETKKEEISSNIQALQDQAAQSAELLYQTSYELMQEKLSQAAVAIGEKYQQEEIEYKQMYLNVMEQSAQELAAALAQKSEELRLTEEKLEVLKAKADATIAAFKREEEKKLEIDKYKILLSKEDLIEINRLREIAPYFRNSRAIYKIIWESYYRNLTTDMINRVIGTGTHTGIYKLTNLVDQKIYIGQAVDLASRWKDHIKAGLGIDTPSNKLYTAMMKDGVENFSFEVLEECARADLNDRETYYIQFYRSQEHGYNMSRGGARK